MEMTDAKIETKDSKERVALELANAIAAKEDIYSDKANFRKRILDLYAECLHTTRGYRDFPNSK